MRTSEAQLRWRERAHAILRALLAELKRVQAANGGRGDALTATRALREAARMPPPAPRPLRATEHEMQQMVRTFRRYADELAAALVDGRDDLAAKAGLTLELAVEQMETVVEALQPNEA